MKDFFISGIFIIIPVVIILAVLFFAVFKDLFANKFNRQQRTTINEFKGKRNYDHSYDKPNNYMGGIGGFNGKNYYPPKDNNNYNWGDSDSKL